MSKYISSKDPSLGGLPDDFLRTKENYHFIENGILLKKDVTKFNSHNILQHGPDGKFSEAMIAFRKGEVPVKWETPPFVYTGSMVGLALGLKLKKVNKLYDTSFGKSSDLEEFKNYYRGVPSKFTGNYCTEFGTKHEGNGSEHLRASSMEPIDLYQTGPFSKKLSEHVLGVASPDGIFSHKRSNNPEYKDLIGTVEIKSRSPYFITDKGYPIETKCEVFQTPPHYYWAQIQWQMLMGDFYASYFVSWSPKKGSKISLIERDEDFCKSMVKILLWSHDKYVLRKCDFRGDDPFLDICFEYDEFLLKLKKLDDTKRGCIIETWEVGDNFEYADLDKFLASKEKEESPKKKVKK